MLKPEEKPAGAKRNIRAYVLDSTEVRNAVPIDSFYLGYAGAAKFSGKNTIQIRFGEKDSDNYPKETNGVFPFCGDITMSVLQPFEVTDEFSFEYDSVNKINRAYYDLIINMWNANYGAYSEMKIAAQGIVKNNLTHTSTTISEGLKQSIFDIQNSELKPFIDLSIKQAIDEFEDGEEYLKYGWGGAGIFYNDIAHINGRMTNAIMNKPQVKSYPHLMTYVCEENLQQNQNTLPKDCYNPTLAQGEPINFNPDSDSNIAQALNTIHDYWHTDPDGTTGNPIINVINVMFGTQGLFDMCKNADVHPLAQLSSMGKGLMEAAIRNIGIGLGLGIASIVPVIGPTAGALSSMAMTFASIGILIGFMLFYLVPFMPFLYFLFAVGGWVKGLFEAMVGVPLWALSHLRIDGQGLPGDGGINGYFLIFEIFIRPILIVFGLIAAVLTFGAMIKVLNEIFGLVVNNLAGNDPTLGEACFTDAAADAAEAAAAKESMTESFRGPVDEFFYTIVYAILVYMIGMASFKLIDLIPNNILRWMGQGIQTFNDQAGEPAEGLMTKMAVGGSILGGQLQSAGQQGAQAIKQGGQGLAQMFNPPQKN